MFRFWISALLYFSLAFKISPFGTFLVVQWLRLPASTAGGMGSIPGPGTKIPHATWRSQKKKKKFPLKFSDIYSTELWKPSQVTMAAVFHHQSWQWGIKECTQAMKPYTHILFLNIFCLFVCFATLCGMQDLSSPTRDWTCVPCSGSVESQPLNNQRSPHTHILN